MKKIIGLFLLCLLPLAANAADFTEGKQYTVVDKKVSKKPEVREFFSLYCPHCYSFEPFMEKVAKSLPKGVKFERNHVDFMPVASKEIQFMLAKAVVVAEQLKMDDKLINALFNYIQVQKAPITSVKDIRNIFVLNGVDGAKFDKLFDSFAVYSKAKAMKKRQDYFAKKGALTGVPTVIVNGKYRINMPELDRNNFEKQYMALINYLLSLDKKAS